MKNKKYEEWENSIEGIAYNLCSRGEATIEDENNKYLICEVLKKLPKEIRNKVLDKVLFVHTIAMGTTEPFVLRTDAF